MTDPAQEAARRKNGQFGASERARPGRSLSDDEKRQVYLHEEMARSTPSMSARSERLLKRRRLFRRLRLRS